MPSGPRYLGDVCQRPRGERVAAPGAFSAATGSSAAPPCRCGRPPASPPPLARPRRPAPSRLQSPRGASASIGCAALRAGEGGVQAGPPRPLGPWPPRPALPRGAVRGGLPAPGGRGGVHRRGTGTLYTLDLCGRALGAQVCAGGAWSHSLRTRGFQPRVLERSVPSARRWERRLGVTVNSFQTTGPPALRSEAAVGAERPAAPTRPARGRLRGAVVFQRMGLQGGDVEGEQGHRNP
ncbi:cuticlin-2-like [Enhydra lutris kenyoni]|uniref:Cuticlin-2-like n=1 Tax=Enhydra lutris kenyoni TaxID=391180 RepID=A0A2Y9JXK2_ENHLU|nr:cuticlin-2-like [Enhydra lutris kenyoni]